MINVRYELYGTEKLGKRHINNAMRRTLYAVGVRWVRRYLKLHFGNRATRRYGYAPRSGEAGSGRPFRGSYTQRKLKSQGHTRPLEHSGEGKRLALYGKKSIKATATGGQKAEAQVTITLPRKFNRVNPKSKTRPPDEIRATNATELEELAVFLTEQSERELTKEGAAAGAVAILETT